MPEVRSVKKTGPIQDSEMLQVAIKRAAAEDTSTKSGKENRKEKMPRVRY